MSTNKSSVRSSQTNSPTPQVDDVARRFGVRLRETRGARTLRDVSMESGVSIAYISDLERAKLKNPSLVTLRKIARALDVSVDYLLGDTADSEGQAGAPVPDALAAFTHSPAYRDAVADLSRRWRADERDVDADWRRVLAGLQIAGRGPGSESDWMFIFETIRRTLVD